MNQLTIAAGIVSVGLVTGAVIASDILSSGHTADTKTFDVVMENNRYNPAEIVANVGDRVVINFENRDRVAHGLSLPAFNATVPGGHIQPGSSARMEFVATRPIDTDAAVCGGASPSDTTDNHGEILQVRVI